MSASISNDRPIIGILTEKIAPIEKFLPKDSNGCSSFIAASYVKYAESSGARVVPIFIGQDPKYYEELMSKINGVILPGGAEYFHVKNGYADAGEHIYSIAKKLNEEKIYFPILGICLGFELLLYLSSGKKEHRPDCKNKGRSSNAIFKDDFRVSRLFQDIPDDIYNSFSNRPIAYYYHGFCITEEVLNNLTMDLNWKVLMTGKDQNELEFINAIESELFPFYGIQFHPEKSAFEWGKDYTSHSEKAIHANRYFGDFFVSECRKNQNKFNDKDEEKSSLIYNYEIVNTGGKKFEQCYVFKHKTCNQKCTEN